MVRARAPRSRQSGSPTHTSITSAASRKSARSMKFRCSCIPRSALLRAALGAGGTHVRREVGSAVGAARCAAMDGRCASAICSSTVIHVPGIPGSVSFNGYGVALSGDLFFAGSIGRTDLPLCGSVRDGHVTRACSSSLPDETVVCPGHGRPTTIAVEMRDESVSLRPRALNQAMTCARTLAISSLVLLAAWLGASPLVAGVVAPCQPSPSLPTRTLAGALVGRVLPVLFWWGMALGVVVALLGGRMGMGRFGLASSILLALL